VLTLCDSDRREGALELMKERSGVFDVGEYVVGFDLSDGEDYSCFVVMNKNGRVVESIIFPDEEERFRKTRVVNDEGT